MELTKRLATLALALASCVKIVVAGYESTNHTNTSTSPTICNNLGAQVHFIFDVSKAGQKLLLDLVPNSAVMVDSLLTPFAEGKVEAAVSSFSDRNEPGVRKGSAKPLGQPNDYIYQMESSMGPVPDAGKVINTLPETAANQDGGDDPMSQLFALYYGAAYSKVGWYPVQSAEEYLKVVVMVTNTKYHDGYYSDALKFWDDQWKGHPIDGAIKHIDKPVRFDKQELFYGKVCMGYALKGAIRSKGCEYPQIKDVNEAMLQNNIKTLFVVPEESLVGYQSLADALGGKVVASTEANLKNLGTIIQKTFAPGCSPDNPQWSGLIPAGGLPPTLPPQPEGPCVISPGNGHHQAGNVDISVAIAVGDSKTAGGNACAQALSG